MQLGAQQRLQLVDVGSVEHRAAIGDFQAQLTAQHPTGVDQCIAQRSTQRLAATHAFEGRQEVGVGKRLVELAEVVEGDLRRRQVAQAGRVLAEITQLAVTHAGARQVAQVFAGGAQVRARLTAGLQADRIQRSEPADGPAQVQCRFAIDRIAAVAFHLHQRGGLAGPGAQGAGQCSQQQVVDLHALRLRAGPRS